MRCWLVTLRVTQPLPVEVMGDLFGYVKRHAEGFIQCAEKNAPTKRHWHCIILFRNDKLQHCVKKQLEKVIAKRISHRGLYKPRYALKVFVCTSKRLEDYLKKEGKFEEVNSVAVKHYVLNYTPDKKALLKKCEWKYKYDNYGTWVQVFKEYLSAFPNNAVPLENLFGVWMSVMASKRGAVPPNAYRSNYAFGRIIYDLGYPETAEKFWISAQKAFVNFNLSINKAQQENPRPGVPQLLIKMSELFDDDDDSDFGENETHSNQGRNMAT